MIVGYIIEIMKKVDEEWFKREVRLDSIEDVEKFFIDNPRCYSIRLRVLRKVDK